MAVRLAVTTAFFETVMVGAVVEVTATHGIVRGVGFAKVAGSAFSGSTPIAPAATLRQRPPGTLVDPHPVEKLIGVDTPAGVFPVTL